MAPSFYVGIKGDSTRNLIKLWYNGIKSQNHKNNKGVQMKRMIAAILVILGVATIFTGCERNDYQHPLHRK